MTSKPSEQQTERSPSRFRPEAVLLLMGALLAGPAQAGVLLQGARESLSLQAEQATVAEVLDALASAFNLRYRSEASLDRPITVQFSGALEGVLPRVLGGYDYVVKRSPGFVDVMIYPRRNDPATAATTIRQSAPKAPAAAPLMGPPVWQSSNSRLNQRPPR